MKKLIILIMLTTFFNLSQAQHLVRVVPDLKLTDSLKSSFTPDTYPSPKALLMQPVMPVQPSLLADNKNTRVVYSRMPVLKVSSNDRMPVAGMGQTYNQDNMPVLKVIVVDPLAKPAIQTP